MIRDDTQREHASTLPQWVVIKAPVLCHVPERLGESDGLEKEREGMRLSDKERIDRQEEVEETERQDRERHRQGERERDKCQTNRAGGEMFVELKRY